MVNVTLNLEDIKRAYSWNSFEPEKRAQSIVHGFNTTIADLKTILTELDNSDMEQIDSDLTEFAQGLKNKYEAWISAKSRTANPMITGSAKFNFERNRKRLDTEHKRLEELNYYEKKYIKRLTKKYTKVTGVDLNKLKIDYFATKELKMYDMSLIKAALERKLINEVKKGRYDEVKEMISDYKIFTKRHGIHKKIEALNTKITTEKTSSITVNGIEIIDNIELDRIQIIFEGKPNLETRNYLKSKSWKWSPKNKAWQNYRKDSRLIEIKQYFENVKEVY